MLHCLTIGGRLCILLAATLLDTSHFRTEHITVESVLLVISLALPAVALRSSIYRDQQEASVELESQMLSHRGCSRSLEEGSVEGTGEELFQPGVRGIRWFREYYLLHRRLLAGAQDVNAEHLPSGSAASAFTPQDAWSTLYREVFLQSPLAQLVYGLLATFLLAVFGFAQPMLQGQLIDKAVNAGRHHVPGTAVDMSELTPYLYIVFACILGNYLAEVLQCIYFALFGNTAVTRVRARLFSTLTEQEMTFHDQHESGQLASRLINDSSKLQDFVQNTSQRALSGIVNFSVALIAMFTTHPVLALVATVITPANLFITRYTGHIAGSYGAVQNQALATANSQAIEALGCIRTVQANGGERMEADRFRRRLSYYLRVIKATVYTQNFLRSLTAFLQKSRDFVVMCIGLYQVMDGQLTIGEYTAFTVYMSRYESGFSDLSGIWVNLQSTVLSMGKFLQLLSARSCICFEGGMEPPDCQGWLQLKDVSFKYRGSESLGLSLISVDARPGTSVAFVGQSGAGKTTLARLIQRYYDPTDGEITLDGNNYCLLNLRWLRRQIGVVEQEPVLFNMSLRENIAYGSAEGASQGDIEQAAKAAKAHDFIVDLPDKYETKVGERALRISGGQKQRCAIARATLRNPKLLLLDEATSALDSQTEQSVQESLEQLMQGKTTILIAHRLSTVMRATEIIVLEKGCVVERGSPKELSSDPESRFSTFMKHQMATPAAHTAADLMQPEGAKQDCKQQ